jgi:hypothetical protein
MFSFLCLSRHSRNIDVDVRALILAEIADLAHCRYPAGERNPGESVVVGTA